MSLSSAASHHAVHELVESARNPQTPEGALALAMVEAVTGLGSALRQSLSDRLWQEIPANVEDSQYLPATDAANGSVVVVQPSVHVLVTYSAVVVSVPAGATGTLRLGNVTIPNLPAGVSSFQVRALLKVGDPRTLTISAGGGGGAASLVLYGLQAAPYGQIVQ